MKIGTKFKHFKITKEELKDLHHNKKLTPTEIARQLNVSFDTVKSKLKSLNIPIQSHFKPKLKHEDLTQDKVEKLYKKLGSIKNVAEHLNIDRDLIRKRFDYKIKVRKNFIDPKILKEEIKTFSPKELSIKYNTTVKVIKQRLQYNKIEIPSKIYSLEETKERLLKFNYNFDNQGFTKQFMFDDPNLYQSVLYYTKEHKLYGPKLTEKIYRIVNDYTPEQQNVCKEVGVPLKFYRYKEGYGWSDLQISKHGVLKQRSNVSQRLFEKLLKELPPKISRYCRFGIHGKERRVRVLKSARIKDNLLNLKDYHLDFSYKNKNIEFDGTHWHKNRKEKDKARDKYLKSKGWKILRIPEKQYVKNPDKYLHKCKNFLLN